MSGLPSEDQTVLPPTLLDDVAGAPTRLDVPPSAPARHADAAGRDAVGADATAFVNDRAVAFAANERAATVLDAAEAATLLDPNARGRRAPATGDATVAPGSHPPSSSDAGTAATVPPPGVRYRREAVAGQGGMGTVHVARDLELLRRVALKELSFEVAHDRSGPLALRARSAGDRATRSPAHRPGLRPRGRVGRTTAYAMKLVEGQTFGQLIADTRAFFEADGAQELALSAPIVGDRGRRLGAAGLVVALDHALANLVAARPVPTARLTLLLDTDGNLLASHTATGGVGGGAGVLKLLAAGDLATVVKNEVGYVETDRLGPPHIMAFDTILPLKWTLVTIAETSAVVGEP